MKVALQQTIGEVIFFFPQMIFPTSLRLYTLLSTSQLLPLTQD